MFDMSWGEMLLIGAAALIFIGPKELPATLRALGQMTGKVRRMAGEFRQQFDEAMRDADVQSIRKEFDSMNDAATAATASASSFNPIETIRNEIKGSVEKPVDDKDRPYDLSPPAGSEAASTPPSDPLIPPPETPSPVDAAAFAGTPAPEPVVGSAPQPVPASADISPEQPAEKPAAKKEAV